MIITGEQSLPKPWHGDPSSSFLLWTKRAACDPLSTSQHTKALASLSHLILSVSLWTVGSRRYEEEGAGTHRRTVQKDLHDPSNHDGVITHHSVCYHPGTRRSQVKSRDGDTNEQWLNAYSRLSAILSTLNILGHLILIEAHELGTMNSHYINEESQAQRCRICQNQ